jgi:hypothetical protein
VHIELGILEHRLRADPRPLSCDVRCDASEPLEGRRSETGYFATSTARDSRITVTLTWPGYSS